MAGASDAEPGIRIVSAILQVRDLSVHFRRSSVLEMLASKAQVTRAVDAVSFDVAHGACTGLVGESGCGKSTLSKTIMRLMKPTSGSVLFEGADIHGLKGRGLFGYRRRVQMIFQDPLGALNPRLTAGETLEEVLGVHGVRNAPDRQARIRSLFDKVGLARDVAGRRPSALSGGQCQRIGIARALAVEPDLVIADESVSALDVSIQAQILNLLRELRRDMGLTMIFVSHDLGVVRYLCDDIIVMNQGRIVERGDTDRIFERSVNPYTRSLIEAMPTLRSHERAIAV
jgi:peptide/nickel transport system ATP-binding protein